MVVDTVSEPLSEDFEMRLRCDSREFGESDLDMV